MGTYKVITIDYFRCVRRDNDTCTGHGYYNVCKIIRSNNCNLTYQYGNIAIYIHLNLTIT